MVSCDKLHPSLSDGDELREKIALILSKQGAPCMERFRNFALQYCPNEYEYLQLLVKILKQGTIKTDRTGTGTISIFAPQMRFDLNAGFPLLTTKSLPFRWIAEELFWFLSGSTNIRPLLEKGVNIWSEWPFVAYLKANNLPVPADKDSAEWKGELKSFEERILADAEFAARYGELGPVYGKQWRAWDVFGLSNDPDLDYPMYSKKKPIDQISQAVETIKNNPDSRRILVSAWNVGDVEEMAKAGLPPCHSLFQFYVADGKLSCQLYQRSADTFLGVPFNIASYALLTMLVAKVCNLGLGEFVWTGGDVHLYLNHLDAVKTQLERDVRVPPLLEIAEGIDNLFDFRYEHLHLSRYEPHPAIKAVVAV